MPSARASKRVSQRAIASIQPRAWNPVAPGLEESTRSQSRPSSQRQLFPRAIARILGPRCTIRARRSNANLASISIRELAMVETIARYDYISLAP
jgi:hypothetical protein